MARAKAGLGIRFRDEARLRVALTHKSYIHERPEEAPESNERLEFLGDAVLGLAIAEELYRRYPELPEGRLTELRSWLVRASTLARVARRLGLGERLYLGRGEEQSGGRSRERNLARALEAVIGALFVDQGYAAARAWTLRVFGPLLERGPEAAPRDHKSELQELVQARGWAPPAYRTVSSRGPDHARHFTVEVVVGSEPAGCGSGRTKRAAEQAAAQQALAWLSERRTPDAD